MNKAPKKVQQLSQTGFRGKMANFVQMLQRVLLPFVVILTSGIADSVAEAKKCPMHAGLTEAKARSLQKEANHLRESCEQVNMNNMLTSKDFKIIKNKDLCTLLKTYFQFYMSLPRSHYSKQRAWSRLMNTMNSSIHMFKTCEENCNHGNGRSQQLLKKQIGKIEKLKHEAISGNGRRSTLLARKNNGNVGTKHNSQRNDRRGHKKAKRLVRDTLKNKAFVENALCELKLLLNHISMMFKSEK